MAEVFFIKGMAIFLSMRWRPSIAYSSCGRFSEWAWGWLEPIRFSSWPSWLQGSSVRTGSGLTGIVVRTTRGLVREHGSMGGEIWCGGARWLLLSADVPSGRFPVIPPKPTGFPTVVTTDDIGEWLEGIEAFRHLQLSSMEMALFSFPCQWEK